MMPLEKNEKTNRPRTTKGRGRTMTNQRRREMSLGRGKMHQDPKERGENGELHWPAGLVGRDWQNNRRGSDAALKAEDLREKKSTINITPEKSGGGERQVRDINAFWSQGSKG